MTGYWGIGAVEADICCMECKRSMVRVRDLIFCLFCFSRDTAEQNVQNLVLRAQLGLMREPMQAGVL